MALAMGPAPSLAVPMTVRVMLSAGEWEALERDPRVAADQHHGVPRPRPPEAEAAAHALFLNRAARSQHVSDHRVGHDLAGRERRPEAMDVGDGRVEAAVAVAPDGKVEDIGSPHTIDLKIRAR